LQLHLAREVEDSADAKSAADHLALSGRGMVLTLVAIHGGQGAGCQPQQPPVALEDTPLKLSFNVPDIEACRSRVTALGGVLKPLAAAWSWQGARHLDGVDPEGNVFQLRQRPG
jgi:predicted enzyme related to lactoylglutathione lyase